MCRYFRDRLPVGAQLSLEELSVDPRNVLVVLSGQEREKMDACFANIGSVSLAAEHGYFYKLSSLPGARRLPAGQWMQLNEGIDLSWKERYSRDIAEI